MTRAEPCVGGAIVVSGRRVLQELCAADGFERAMRRLPEEVRRRYLAATALTWLPVSVIDRVIEACGAELGKEPLDLNDEVSRIATERALGSFWRLFLRFTSDRALLSRTPRIYSRTYDTGRIVPSIEEPGQAEVALVDFPGVPESILRPLRVGIETTLRCAGRAHARVAFDRTADGAVFHCRWHL